MPVLVVGADSTTGRAIVDSLLGRGGEVRAFVTDPGTAQELRSRGVKVALGDASDASHIGAAALGCFTAVLVGYAAEDDRERAFSDSPAPTREAWASAVRDAEVSRVVWVSEAGEVPTSVPPGVEVFVVPTNDRSESEVASEVARIDDLRPGQGA